MIPTTLEELARVTRGRVDGDPELVVSGPAFVDSRSAQPGGLFVAVPGERVDGHDFAASALAAGAAAVLGSRPTGLPSVIVDDPVLALGRIARSVLDRLPGVAVIALTGSQGKTGTKDFLAQVLARSGQTVATAGNHNNEIGVPLTVLEATEQTLDLVVEMGARGVGHVAYLCQIAPPRIGAVLNVGSAHLGEFGSQEAIAQAKGELVEALPGDGTAVLNADDPLTAAMASRTGARVLSFGQRGEVTWRDTVLDDLGRPRFDLGYGGNWAPVRLRLLGEHQVPNAAAAAAMSIAAGLDLDTVAAGLSGAVATSRWRMEPHTREDGLVVINDAYNANPDSMVAAVRTLAEIGDRTGRRRIAVLGEMRELGAESAAAHDQVGAEAAELGVEVVVSVGPAADHITDGARSVSGWDGLAVTTAGRDDALAWLGKNVRADDVVLVKASRGAALEHLVDGLLNTPTEEDTRR